MVLKYLDSEINKEIADEDTFGFQDDKRIKNECDILNRPDRMYDCKTHFVIVEVDENQHKGKRSSCSRGEAGELARMNNIQVATGMNCIFLRFNPDIIICHSGRALTFARIARILIFKKIPIAVIDHGINPIKFLKADYVLTVNSFFSIELIKAGVLTVILNQPPQVNGVF